VTTPSYLGDNDHQRRGIIRDVSTIDKPWHAHAVDVVPDAGPFLVFLRIPLKTIHRRLTVFKQAASGID
jgi:hypothetical protein